MLTWLGLGWRGGSNITEGNAPLDDELKFNVDGSCNLELGRAEIGNILRDSNGVVLHSFSAFVGKVNAHTTELMAIHKACILSAVVQ
ncbi:hypothetical protein QYF36_026104 [Acer negundo]|nr:hypothetical protein QYF36_026104 [Acer negundo]